MGVWKLAVLRKHVKGGRGSNEGEGRESPRPDAPEGPEGGEGGKGGGGRGTSKGEKFKPEDYQKLDQLTNEQVRSPEPTVANEAGESSTPDAGAKTMPIVVMDPVVTPFYAVGAMEAAQSVTTWNQRLRTIRVSALRLSLRRLMQRSDNAGKQGGLRSGRLRGRGIVRLMNGAENVFERRFKEKGEDVAVTLLIDRSGSMSGENAEQAADVALLIGETASNAGAKLEVIAFDSAMNQQARQAMEQAMKDETKTTDLGRGTRWGYADASDVSVAKSFNDHVGKLRRMYLMLRRMSAGGTNDASALQWAGERLLKEYANRRILFVIADGIGDSTMIFRSVVDKLEKRGVIVIGIGIGCNEKNFRERFTHAVAIQKPSDLCAKAFGLLIGTIAKARGFA